ncbi:MAG TPA: ATP-dependent zinc metalloprotease FtsH [Dehalococcoidales bacterium]|nr:ATP-dependent zinc metalloprotease FtsH [Dehalococcoidales bacterium]
MMKSNWMRNSLIYVIILVAAVVLLYQLFPTSAKPTEVGLEQAITMSQEGEIAAIIVDDGELLLTTLDGRELVTATGNLSLVELQELGLNLKDVDYKVKPAGFDWGSILISFLPLLLFGALIFFLFRSARGANSQAMSFGRSRARLMQGSTPTVTFDDVAGVEEAKQELHEVVEFLKSREKFQSLGARIPKGILLIGPPGTGKTLLARAVAGEAGVPFFSISGSEFVEMFVGVGASRVRDLFDQAKRNTPCIIFIDEIDAVGRHRGAGLGGGHDEREQTLNQILVEMDGFDTNTSVIILAATNRPDILDPALLRPGRFDRRVILDRPDINGRTAILKVHSKGKPLDDEVDLEVLAKQTAGFSGADLANLLNEAAILAARRGQKVIKMADLEESIDRVIAGPERKSRRISPKEKEIGAYHEAGHALVAKLLPNADPVHKVSIVARGMMGGYTRLLPTEDRYLMTRSQFKDMIATLLAGQTAEELIFKEMTTGAQNDIEEATKLARKMVTSYGMSEKLGPRTFGHKEEMVFLGREITEQRDYSEKVAQDIDEEVYSIIQHAHDEARRLLTENKARLIHIAEKILVQETIEGEDLELAFTEPLTTKPKAKPATQPVAESPKAKAKTAPKKAAQPRIIPKQAPASS